MSTNVQNEVTYEPSSFPTPNEVMDKYAYLLLPEDYLVLSFTIRHIIGWEKKRASRQGFISLSEYEFGFQGVHEETGEPYHHHGTGLPRPVICASLKRLVAYGFIKKIGLPHPFHGQLWHLPRVAKINLDAMLADKAVRDAKNARKVQKAARASADKRGGTVHVPGTTDVPGGYGTRTGSGTTDVPLFKNNWKNNDLKQDQDSPPPADAEADTANPPAQLESSDPIQAKEGEDIPTAEMPVGEDDPQPLQSSAKVSPAPGATFRYGKGRTFHVQGENGRSLCDEEIKAHASYEAHEATCKECVRVQNGGDTVKAIAHALSETIGDWDKVKDTFGPNGGWCLRFAKQQIADKGDGVEQVRQFWRWAHKNPKVWRKSDSKKYPSKFDVQDHWTEALERNGDSKYVDPGKTDGAKCSWWVAAWCADQLKTPQIATEWGVTDAQIIEKYGARYRADEALALKVKERFGIEKPVMEDTREIAS
jgi:hypothetical protein